MSALRATLIGIAVWFMLTFGLVLVSESGVIARDTGPFYFGMVLVWAGAIYAGRYYYKH